MKRVFFLSFLLLSILILVYFTIGLGGTKQKALNLYNTKEIPYLKIDFNDIDTIALWDFKIDYKYRIKESAIQPIGIIKFWRIKPVKDKLRREIYGKDWTPSISFEIYKISDLDFCKNRSLNTRMISSCYNFGGDLLKINNYLFLNNEVCVDCKKSDNDVDYCRPLINKILTEIELTKNCSIQEIEKEIRERIKNNN